MRLVELEKEIKELKKLLTEATTLSKQLKSVLESIEEIKNRVFQLRILHQLLAVLIVVDGLCQLAKDKFR